MSNSEFEQRVIDTAESFGNQKDIIYQLFPNSSDAGELQLEYINNPEKIRSLRKYH